MTCYRETICPDCSGSGEGTHDGTTCRSCKGSGVDWQPACCEACGMELDEDEELCDECKEET